MSYTNDEMNEYMKERYHKRRKRIIEGLGGECSECGKQEDLEIDHIDPETKSFAIGKKLASVSKDKLDAEVEKCQLLCRECHDQKTTGGSGRKMVTMRCPCCGSEFTREYRNIGRGKRTYCSQECVGKAVHMEADELLDGPNLIDVFFKSGD